MRAPNRSSEAPLGTVREVFGVFLGLGLTSFGGPVAHLGYFREAFVVRRRWLTETAYADLVALCQFLPGPASSQVGMGIGLQRAGIRGLLAAWVAFTLPSAIALVAFGYGLTAHDGDTAWIAGLKAAAVAVVTHALIGMARTLTPDAKRAIIAVVATAATLALAGALGQVAVIVAAGLVGYLWLRPDVSAPGTDDFRVPVGRRTGAACLATFGVLLVGLPVAASVVETAGLDLFADFFRAGSLVFGGGHVVLPLLESGTVQTGLVAQDDFLAGYGAAQAVPGPLFTFAAFLGSVAQTGPTGVVGAAIALVAIFLPSALLVVGGLPFWERLRAAPRVRRGLMGVNAGVVGLLAAALWTPVVEHGVTSLGTGLVALGCFAALQSRRVPPWLVVLAAGAVGYAAL